jgi:phage shock protein A
VSFGLRMSAEIGDWLAEVTAAEPVTAAEVGAALVVLTEANEVPGPPLVTDLAAEQATPASDAADPREAVDYAYQELLEALQHVRLEVAEAASYRATTRVRIQHFGDGRPDVIEQLPLSEEELAEAARREEELTRRSIRLQSAVDAFRTAKETAKAMYTAAEASLRVQAAIVAAESSGVFASDSGGSAADAESAVRDEEATEAELNEALGAAEASLAATLAQARRTLRDIRTPEKLEGQQRDSDDQAEDPREQAAAGRDDAPVPGLFELRADPLGSDTRILFAIEPAGTATLLAVLDGEEAVHDHRDEAVELAGDLLTEIRGGSWPPTETEGTETGEVCFDDAATLLAKLFPDRGAEIRARAAELAEVGTFAALRRERELSIADVAATARLAEHRVWEIEHAGLRSVELHEAAAYVRALGGRLDLTATFGSGERTSLS